MYIEIDSENNFKATYIHLCILILTGVITYLHVFEYGWDTCVLVPEAYTAGAYAPL